MTVTFDVPVRPRGKGRARIAGRHVIADRQTYEYEMLIKTCYINQIPASRRMHHGPVMIEMQADFAPPASWSKQKKQAAINGDIRHTSKPDLDNVVKCLDALNKLAWEDDRQIIGIVARKLFAKSDNLRITIMDVEDET